MDDQQSAEGTVVWQMCHPAAVCWTEWLVESWAPPPERDAHRCRRLRDNFTQSTVIWSLCCDFPPSPGGNSSSAKVWKSWGVTVWKAFFPTQPRIMTLDSRLKNLQWVQPEPLTVCKHQRCFSRPLAKAASPMAACSLAALRGLIHLGAHWLVHALLSIIGEEKYPYSYFFKASMCEAWWPLVVGKHTANGVYLYLWSCLYQKWCQG